LLHLFASPFCFTTASISIGKKKESREWDLDCMTTISRLKILDLFGHELKSSDHTAFATFDLLLTFSVDLLHRFSSPLTTISFAI